VVIRPLDPGGLEGREVLRGPGAHHQSGRRHAQPVLPIADREPVLAAIVSEAPKCQSPSIESSVPSKPNQPSAASARA
jgi:hypothetical protein